MRQPSLTGFLPDLQKPLRDAIRGVATIADATEEMLEPAANLLPEPVRNRFRDALSAVEQAGQRLMAAPIDPDHVRQASDFVLGTDNAPAAREACASVICFAWEHLQTEAPDHRYLISETLLAAQLAQMPEVAPQPGAKAAALLASIRTSSVIGRMPGVSSGLSGSDRDAADLTLSAIFVWLLTARDGDIGEEEKLLDLASALISAIGADVLSVMDDPDELAALLVNAARHL